MIYQPPPQTVMPERRRLDRLLVGVLTITALDTIYLAWRFIALVGGWVQTGTGICSWSAWVDCDKVLSTPQAHAFYVPNAVLGLGLYTGCLIWVVLERRLGPGYQPHIIRSLTVWLAIASAFTLFFWSLLIRLSALCPFCPWNHVLMYVALGVAWRLWRITPHPAYHQPWRPLLALVGFCMGWFWLVQGLWLLLFNAYASPLPIFS